MPIESQTLSLSPIPAIVLESLEQTEPLWVAFRPEQVCNNGCFVSDRNGWLSIRRTDDESLLLGIADVRRLLEPVDELEPFDVSAASSACAQISDALDCDVQGGTAPLQVTVSDGDDAVAIVGAGAAALGDYAIVLSRAIEGEWDPCTFDGGDRNYVGLLVVQQ